MALFRENSGLIARTDEAAPIEPGGVRELLIIALPMVVSQACETLMMFINRLFLARLGPEHMSAAMGGGLTCFMFMTFFLGLTGYGSALVAQHLGANQRDRCAVVVAQTLLLAILAYPLVLLCIPLGHAWFRLNHIAPGQLPLQIEYFDIIMLGAIIGLLRNSLAGFFSGTGRTRVLMGATVAAMAVNLASSYLLIFGAAGFPALGMRGAAISSLLGSTASLIVVAYCYFNRQQRREFGVAQGLRFDRAIMVKLLRFGYPAGIEFFLNIMAFNLLVMTFYSCGPAVAAAVTITFNWDMVSFVPLIGVNIAVTSLVGRYMGAGRPDRAHRAAMSGLKLAGIYSLFTLTLYACLPGPLVGLFRPSGDDTVFRATVPLAVFMVRLISLYVFADAVGLVFGGALRGAGDTFWTMCISVSGHWVVAATAAVLIHALHVRPAAAWLTVVFLALSLGSALFLRYRSGRWRHIRMVDAAPAPGAAPAD